MSNENKIKATAKNLEGKTQEAIGEVTGDPETKLQGQAKQGEAQGMHLVEDIKDKARDVINAVKKKLD